MKEKAILSFKKFLYYHFDLFNLREKSAIQKVQEITKLESEDFENSNYKVGIVKEKWHLHSHYIQACKELQISYTVIDLFKSDWVEQIKSLKVDFLMVRPSVQYSPWKEMFDNRLKLIKEKFNLKVYPDNLSLWLWENKLRTLDWLKAKELPHVESFIFYEKEDAFKFGVNNSYPIVYKSNSGSGSSGVKILKNNRELKDVIDKSFKVGIRTYRKHKLDKEHGHLILQKYIKDVKEWRIIRIGEYYFGFEKLRNGEFHSGSHQFGYGMPPKECLDLVKRITDEYSFYFVDIDVFIDRDGKLYVNEIQPYFGQKDDRELLVVNDKPGRLFYDPEIEDWQFEEGKYCRNNTCNLRIKEAFKLL